MSGSTASTPQANDVLENIDAGINSLNSGTVPQKANNNTPRRSQIEILQSIAVGVDGLAGAISEGAGVSETAVQALVDNATETALGTKADKTELAAALATKADTAAVTDALAAKADATAIAAKADKTDLNQVKTTADAALPKTGGTASELKVSTTPTQDTHVARKKDLDEAILVLPSLASVATRILPTAVTAFRVLGYATPSDGGESGPWVRVSSEPTHPGKKKDASGAWFELQTMTITPGAFGAFPSTSDQTTQLTNMRDYWLAKLVGSYGDQYRPQPELRFPAGQFRAPGLLFSTDKTCFTLIGSGDNTILDGIMLNPYGFRYNFRGFTLADSRGITAGVYGIKFGGATQARNGYLCDVRIRDRYVALWNYSMAASLICDFKLEKNTIAIYSANPNANSGGDSSFVGFYCSNNDYTFYNRGTGEFKFSSGHLYGATYSNAVWEGDARINTLECYYTNCTFSNLGGTRDFTPKRIIDNGSGYARAIIWENLTISSAVRYVNASGTRFSRGSTLRLADAIMSLSSATGQVTSLQANGVELLSAPITWATAAAGATAIAAAINANTAIHGYTAYVDVGTYVYVVAPGMFDGSAQNGWTLNWTLASGTASGRCFYVITTTAAHGFSAGDAVEFNGGSWIGTEITSWVDSDTVFAVDGGTPSDNNFPVFTSGLVTRALRVKAGQDQCKTAGFTKLTTYNRSPMVIMACGPGWVDLGYTSKSIGYNVPYVGNDVSGTITFPRWGVQAISWDTMNTVNDQFVGGSGNVNTTLIRGSYCASFVGQRTKVLTWIDTPVNTMLQCNGFEKIGIGRGRGPTYNVGTGNFSIPAGAAAGWCHIGFLNMPNNGLLTPQAAYSGPGMLAPHRAGGLVNGTAAMLNRVQVLEDRVQFEAGGLQAEITEFGIKFPAFTFATLPTPANGNGCTVRVTDRNNKLVTSDGTNWRDQAGAILT